MTTTVRAPDTLQTEHGPLPRDPEDYVATDHFRYRFRHRTGPEITGDVVSTCITEGTIVNEPVEPNVFFFDACVRGIQWRLIVRMSADPPHPVITAFAPQEHSPDDDEVPPV